VRLSFFVFAVSCLLVTEASLSAQVTLDPVSANANQITVNDSTIGDKVGIFSTATSGSCGASSKSLPLAAGISNATIAGGKTILELNDKLIAGEIICAMVTPPGVGDATKTKEITVDSAPATDPPAINPVQDVSTDTVTIILGTAPVGSTVEFYSPAEKAACTDANSKERVQLLPATNATMQKGVSTAFILAAPLKKGMLLCAILKSAAPTRLITTKIIKVGTAVADTDDPCPTSVSTHCTIPYSRVMAGIDVSAASSADPAAKFLGEADIDLPLTFRAKNQLFAHSWLWGFARIASIQEPGAVSGISNPVNYVSALTAQAPNNIVQSFEASAGYELRLLNPITIDKNKLISSVIFNAGLVTPVSISQNGTPTVYTVTPALYTYYANLAANHAGNIVYQENATNLAAACPGATATSVPTCYIAQYPVARSRFYRNYAAGFRFKQYYLDKGASTTYSYPSVLDMTIGQNEFVSSGILRHFIAHVAGSTPIVGLPGLYAYAAFDLEVTTSGSASQQFQLNSPASSITSTSPNVAAIFVKQPDSDRYRFGLAFDLNCLINMFKSKTASCSAPAPDATQGAATKPTAATTAAPNAATPTKSAKPN
jgi:hypothetical protein